MFRDLGSTFCRVLRSYSKQSNSMNIRRSAIFLCLFFFYVKISDYVDNFRQQKKSKVVSFTNRFVTNMG